MMRDLRKTTISAFLATAIFLTVQAEFWALAEETEMKPLPPEEAEKVLKATVKRHQASPAQKSGPQVIISAPREIAQSWVLEMEKVGVYDAHEKKGAEYFGVGQYEAAVAEYQESLRQAQEMGLGIAISAAHRNLAETYEASGDFKDALQHLQILLDHWPSDFTRPKAELWKEALEAAASEHFGKAVDIYTNLLQKAEEWERPKIQYRLEAMKARAAGRTPPPPAYLVSSNMNG